MALHLLGQSAVLLKSDSIYQITTIAAPLFYAVSRVADYIGTIAPQTTREIPGLGLAFLWRNDIYVFGGLGAPTPLLGGRGETLRRSIFQDYALPNEAAAFAISDIAMRRYLLFTPTEAFTVGHPVYACWVYNWLYQTWATYEFALPGGVCGGGDGIQRFIGQIAPRVVIGGQDPPAMYYAPDPRLGVDAGGPFQSAVLTGLSDLSGGDANAVYSRHKTLRRFAVSGTAVMPGVQIALSVMASDNGIATRQIGPITAGLTGALPATVWPDVTAVWFALQMDDQAQSVPFDLDTAYVDVEMAGDR
jgi:hypothetical protein